jgi:transcriptional regulator with XRE-family HTH domain
MPYKEEIVPNNIRQIREANLIDINEMVKRTGLSPSTVRRVEEGGSCRLETKRKILVALGIELEDQRKVFPNE